MSEVEFSPALREQLDEADEVFSNFQSKINAVTQEIKALEDYLRTLGIPFDISLECASDEEGFWPTCVYSLVWDSDKGRLSCRSRDKESGKPLAFKPLLEARLANRIILAKYLPAFVKEVSEKLYNLSHPDLSHSDFLEEIEKRAYLQ